MNCLCRFYPSCSEFAKLSLARHGFFKAVSMSYGRVRRCTLDNTETCIDFP
jgi:putative component of membrane protein insertase Oxa1/YidC/SpoIIIJ protein YidD